MLYAFCLCLITPLLISCALTNQLAWSQEIDHIAYDAVDRERCICICTCTQIQHCFWDGRYPDPRILFFFFIPSNNCNLNTLFFHMRHPSLMLECKSLIPILIRRPPRRRCCLSLLVALSPPEEGSLAPLIVGPRDPSGERSTAKTSTIHSYQTFRSSVCRYIVTTISPFSGTPRGV